MAYMKILINPLPTKHRMEALKPLKVWTEFSKTLLGTSCFRLKYQNETIYSN